jgi:NAD(P)-dependent dehydrogenase (short-subunit alcohol dehydrogenase family)
MDCVTVLRGKKIILFGASRGIGFNIASHLLSKGSEVTISSGNEANLNAAQQELGKQFTFAKVSKIQADFNKPASLDTALNPLLKQGAFNAVVISSAVLGPSGDFTKTDLEYWRYTFDVNVFGPIFLVHYLLRHNLICKNGKIIFLSGGISGPDPYFISFSSSKHALNGFAYSLAYQLAKKDIWVNSILPGSYHTDMNKTRIARGLDNIGSDNYLLALSRVKEDETAKYHKLYSLMEWLCSPLSDGIYGRLISAQYDDWQNHAERLKDERDELYRIVRKKD